jgi:tetratricopeptide (TPR) repeat protein
MPQPLRIALFAFVVLGILGLLTYAFVQGFRRTDDPVKLAVKWMVTLLVGGALFWLAARGGTNSQFGAFVLGLACIAVGVILSLVWAPSIGRVLASPITSLFDGGGEELEPQPLYSIAEALRKRGKPREAVYAIQEQLQKFPKDVTGQMLLAEIQAENLNDLQAAEITLHRLCEQKHAPATIAFALSSLADWHLKFAQDPEAARAALEKIIELLPGTEFERSAANRIAHLGSTSVLLQSHEADTVKLKPGVEYLGLLKDQSHLLPKEVPYEQRAAELAAHLQEHPLDHEAREQLAAIYAGDYGRLDLATDQVEQLVALPGESPRHVARWLNMLVDFQLHCTGATEAAAATLHRIIDLFPNSAHAQKARDRLTTLALELKRYEKSRVVKLGSHESAS